MQCHANGVGGDGPSNADVVFVGIAPGRDEVSRSGKPFTGQSGKLLNASLKAFDIERENVYVTNLICWWKNEPDEDDIGSCAPRLEAELRYIQPKVIVALGALASKRLTGHPKFNDSRGSCSWSDEFNCWVICTWHPAAILRAPALIADFVRDLWKINYIIDKPKNFNEVTYKVVKDVSEAQAILDSEWAKNAQFLSNDIETKYIDGAYVDDIRCLGISDGDLTYVFPEEVVETVTWPVERNWTWHNGMFDTRVFITDLGVELPIVEDTMLMSYSLDERGGSDSESPVDLAVGIHGLKRLSREYCAADFYDIDTRYAKDEELWEYNAKDAAYTARLAKLFYQRQLEDGRTREVYETLTLPQARLSRDEFMHGVYVHMDVLTDVAIKWSEEWLELDEHLVQEAEAYGFANPDGKRFNFNSPKQLKRFINHYLHVNVPDTRKETLADHVDDHDWLKKYQRLKRIDKQLSTYVLGTRNVLYPDGRVRPVASLHGTMSGRLTYHKPPIGTVPSGAQYVDPDSEPDEETHRMIEEFSQIRGLYGAPSGSVFVEADYEAAELWTAAYQSKDDIMLRDLLSGDFHSNAAEKMFKVSRNDYPPDQWKQMRRESKFVTFGVLYNRGARSLYAPQAGQGGNLGKKYTLRELEQMVVAWHEEYWKHWEWAQNEIKVTRRTGEQESITGRKRRYHAPDLFGKHFANMAVNWPIQSTAHDHLIVARLDLDNMFRGGQFPGRTLWDGHDAIYFEIPGSYEVIDKKVIPHGPLADALPIIKEVMEKPRWYDMGLRTEIKVGTSWADGKVWHP